MADPRGYTALSEMEQLKRKQTLERAKANYLSSQLKLRLQYARLKVDHGWQRQSLSEVENLYFRHTHKKPTLSRADTAPIQGSTSSTTLPSAKADSTASSAQIAIPPSQKDVQSQPPEADADSSNVHSTGGLASPTAPGPSSTQHHIASSSHSLRDKEPPNPSSAAPDTDVTMSDATKAPTGKRASKKKGLSRAKAGAAQSKNGAPDAATTSSTTPADSSTNASTSNSQHGSTTTISRRGGRSRASYKRESYSPSMFASTPGDGASYDSFWQSHSSTSQSYRHLLSQTSTNGVSHSSTVPSVGNGEAPTS
ncbi:hypothetical protein K474DRAFT_1707776 [Panus rudis PR-1116 ss-1]|nr:hypothetical protein K474DRAFT_1707776 [Panus rudis PR-1116 ss-1]